MTDDRPGPAPGLTGVFTDIIRDADMIVNIAEEMGHYGREKLGRVIDKSMVTAEGRRIAAQRYLNEP